MNHLNRRGISLLEVIVVILLIAIVTSLCLPLMSTQRGYSRRTACSSNMSSIGKVMILYADHGGNGEMYPTLGGRDEPGAGDAQMALNLLYKSFINDIRVFSCSSKPMSQKNMDNVAPSSLAGWKLRSLKEEPPGNPALWTVSSSYGYSPGHRQEDGQVIVLADHQGGGANSDNHGFNKGQNCLAAAGNVEFKDSPVNKVGTDEKSGEALMDLDIYKRGGVSPAGKVEMDSYCR